MALKNLKKITKKAQKKLDRKEDRKKLKAWSIDVKKDWNNKCAICGKEEYLNSHHIIPKQIKEFKYNLINGIALCPSCHKFSFKCSPHKNPLIFFKVMNKRYPARMIQLDNLLDKSKTIHNGKESKSQSQSQSNVTSRSNVTSS